VLNAGLFVDADRHEPISAVSGTSMLCRQYSRGSMLFIQSTDRLCMPTSFGSSPRSRKFVQILLMAWISCSAYAEDELPESPLDMPAEGPSHVAPKDQQYGNLSFAVFKSAVSTGDVIGRAGNLSFAVFKSAVSTGDVIGRASFGLFCGNEKDIFFSANFMKGYQVSAAKAFKDSALAHGIPLFKREVSAFEAAPQQDPDFRLGATLLEINYKDVCVSASKKVKGSLSYKIKWEVFSTKQQKVVYTTVNTGTYQTQPGDDLSSGELEKKAFLNSVNSVFDDQAFRDVIKQKAAASAALTNGSERLRLKGAVPPGKGTKVDIEALKPSVVTIQTFIGSGSGFFINESGYVLTDYHVVRNYRYVKLKTASGKEFVGEVIKVDPTRDVALIKADVSNMPALYMRYGDPVTGEDVYAIGSPRGEKFSGTFSKGVFSAMRKDHDLSYLQCDISINPGNSGGPLFDASGAVIGIAALKLKDSEGMAFFIPIKEALERLSVELN
jgi:serine protease Do